MHEPLQKRKWDKPREASGDVEFGADKKGARRPLKRRLGSKLVCGAALLLFLAGLAWSAQRKTAALADGDRGRGRHLILSDERPLDEADEALRAAVGAAPAGVRGALAPEAAATEAPKAPAAPPRPAPPPPVAPPPRVDLSLKKRANRIWGDMPPFAAPRMDPLAIRAAHLATASEPLSAAACADVRRKVPMHVKALDLVHLSPEPASPTVMCVIYTYSKNHLTSAAAAAQTWLPRCDGALILSDKNDSLAVAVPHEGPEEYSNIWQKTRANWRYVYEYYRDDFDYWIFGGDDLFVVPQNLKAYLATPEIRAQNDRGDALFLGRRFKQNGNEDRMFNSGGAGYVLNKRSLTLLYDALDQAFCQPHLHGFWEDVMVAQCLKKGPARLLPYDTRDARGRERFHPFSPGQHYTYSPPGERSGDWYPKYSIDLKFGDECCSPESVAYHYIKPDLMRQMDAVVFKCPLRP